MATDVAKYYLTQNIVVYPSSNSIDNGKLTIEENLKNMVSRITSRNYALKSSDFVLSIVGGKIQIGAGSGNIQGYDVVSSAALLLDNPISEVGYKLIGLKVTKDGSNHVRGEVLDGNDTYFEGIWAGFFPEASATDPDLLILGRVYWDGLAFTELVRDSKITHRIDADKIDIDISGPKPTAVNLDLEGAFNKLPDWYVSKYGDFMVGNFELISNNGITEGLAFPSALASARFTVGTSTNTGATLASMVPSNNNIFSKLMSTATGFTGLSSGVANNVTNIGFPTSNSTLFRIQNTTTGGSAGSGNIDFVDGKIIINSLNKGIEIKSPNGSLADNLTALLSSNTLSIKTATSNKHTFGYDSTGTNPYYTIGSLTLRTVGTDTSIVSNGNVYVQIAPSISTGSIVASGSVKTGVGISYIIEDENSLKQYVSNVPINLINVDGLISNKSYGLTPTIATPYSGTYYSKTSYEAGVLQSVYKNTLGNSSIKFIGSGSNSAELLYNYTTSRLNLTGDFTVSGDIKASRVYNAVYNDYADFVKMDKSMSYEPGDIVSKKVGVDEYTLATETNKKLVVGVYSDTYGQVLGGDDLDNMEDNLENYIPIAVAGNVFVKVIGTIEEGDLITVSCFDGVGVKVTSIEDSFGTIIGKALESKTSYGVSRIKAQVILL